MTDPKTIPYFEDSIRVDDVTGFPTLTFDGERYGLPTFTARLTPEAARRLGRLLTAVCDAMEVADPGVAEPALSADPAWPPSPFDVDTPGPIHDEATAAAILRRRAEPPAPMGSEERECHERCMAYLRERYLDIEGGPDLIAAAERLRAVEATLTVGPRFSDPRVALATAEGRVFEGAGWTLREAVANLRPASERVWLPFETHDPGWTRTEPPPDPLTRVRVDLGSHLIWDFGGHASARMVQEEGATVVVVTPRRPDGTEADPSPALARASGRA
jgi:hypothetical protein